MLIGEYRPSIDAKGRINFPSKLREDLGESFIVTKSLGDKCLTAYSMEEWKKLEEKMASYPVSKAKAIQRFVFAGAVCAEPDKQGRVLIPQTLRDYAGLSVGEIVVVGVSNRAEIWSVENWDTVNADIAAESFDELLNELGF